MPLLKPVLGRVLPLMGAVKLDNMQWVFANGELIFMNTSIIQAHSQVFGSGDLIYC